MNQKNRIIFFLLFCFILIPIYSQQRTEKNTGIIGDVNSDNQTNIVDVLHIAKFSTGFTPAIFNKKAADMDKDGKITMKDALLLAKLTVAQNMSAQITQTLLTGTPLFTDSQLTSWGLGSTVIEYHKNDRNYEWYIDQIKTGTHGYINCGPASVTMALKWINKSFNKTSADARATYRPTGGWWFTSDIINYLKLHKAYHDVMEVSTDFTQFRNLLIDGHLLILCLNMKDIPHNPAPKEHTHSFYKSVTGHFIIIKGYMVIDNKIYFEAYDPFSINRFYPESDQKWPKGKDRYYLWEDLQKAIKSWWNYAIIVKDKKYGDSKSLSHGKRKSYARRPDIKYVNPDKIKHNCGAGY